MRRNATKLLSLFLTLCMLVGIVPMWLFVSAAETVLDAAIFCSDVHGSTSDLTSVLSGVKTSGVDYSSIGFVGDTCLTVANTTSIVQSALGDTDISVMFSYASSHDTEDGADISTNWDYSGEVKGVSSNYLVYTIRETDMQNSSGASTAAPAFTTWYNGLTAAQKALPIFIMSHRPLHARRNDNAGAATWYSAISAAAETSDIVFFWGHNHTGDNSVDQAAYYVAKDGTETFTVYNGDTVVPNFTYMNAGYINANNQNPARKGIATTVQITADSLIFQDYNSSGEYTGTYAHNVTVAREFAVTKKAVSIDVTGETRYTVGGNSLAFKVTATYDDGTTDVVTDACTFTGCDLNTSGTYTVTATYGELTDTIDIVVAAYGECVYDGGALDTAVEVVSAGVTEVAIENVWGEPDLSDTFSDYAAYNIDLTGYTTGNEIEYTISIVDGMDLTNLGLYHVAMVDGETVLTPIEFVIENDCIVFTSDLTGTFAYGAITVPVGYELYSIEASNYTKDWFVGDSLLLTAPFAVTATYKKTGSDDFIRVISRYEENNNPDGYMTNMDSFDMTTAGKYDVEISYTYNGVTVTTTFPISVWGDSFTSSGVTVELDTENGKDYGVTAVTVGESNNANVSTAISGVISGNNYVAYDISLTFADGYETTNSSKDVTLPIPDGVENPVVYYVSDNGYVVSDMNATNNGDGTVSFKTTHFSTYVVGERTEIEVPDPETATGSGTTTTTETKTVYVLTSSISSGNDYLIVNGNSAGSYYALANNSGSVAAPEVTVKSGDVDGDGDTETYIELDDATDELWTVSNSYRFQNDGYYLRYSSGLGLSTSGYTTWSYSNNRLSYSSGWRTYYLRYSSGWTTTTSSGSATSIYFYVPTEVEIETTTTVAGTYSIDGADETVPAIKGTTVDLSVNLNFAPTTGTATTNDVSETVEYEIVNVDADGNTVNGDPLGVITKIEGNKVTLSGNTGKALVKVSYTTEFGDVTDYITLTATTPDHYTIELHKAELTEVTTTEFDEGVTYYTYNSTTGAYEVAVSYVEGTTYYTTPVIQGDEITSTVVLKGIEAGDTYSVWAVVKAYADTDDTDGVDVGALGDALSWTVSDESIATIDTDTGVITFTGNNYGSFTVTVAYEGTDGKPVTDTITISVTESLYTVPEDGTDDFPEYPNEGAVRFDKTATAVGNYSETGIAKVELSMTGVPYTTGNELDVVIMMDMTGSMSDDAMIAAEEAAIAFAESIVKNEDGTYNKNRICIMAFNSGSSSPFTYWELGTVTADKWDSLCTAVRTASDDQVSGGTPYDEALAKCREVLQAAKTDGTGDNRQQFCVFMSDGGPTSYQYITNYDAVKNGTATEYTTSSASATGGSNQSDSNFATIATYTHEYYSTLMKDEGVTMYTVLTGLVAANYPNCTTILQNIASDSSKAYVVEDGTDTSGLSGVLTSIGQKILEAAKDVVVEDKIGNKYTINFGLPGYGTDYSLEPDSLDGLENFYIQVVDYVLDAETHERTGVYTVLENFTFNLDGSLKSHTVDGVECSGCTHVTTFNGIITAIDGTYFDYKSDSTGEYLTWTAEKISSTELALQYFAHLDNSSGVAEKDQVPAGTYYTNEYATLTYTNYKGNAVQQEFPIPQLTWYGAQVSYVFYLVNENGEPVNKAGRVVPFAEAVYVTDVYTYAVVWNDLEQSAGLEAKYLANEKVSDAYDLYDPSASYNIHVYADEEGVNLNNHFIIGGTSNTTYVFNTKADDIKYCTPGAYIANDLNDATDSTSYLCKGDGKVSDVIWSEKTLTSDSDLVNGVYFYDVDGKKIRALEYVEGTTYYELTGAKYSVASGETQWKPSTGDSTTGGTVINDCVYYVDDNGVVYTIVQKTDGTEVRTGFDFANTTVAFAVVWKPQLAPDTVIIDFGLDVVIDVITNDAMAAGVNGVMLNAPSATTEGSYDNEVGSPSVESETGLWKATAENLNSVRFHLNNMLMDKPAVFYYEAAVNYYDSNNELKKTYMYSSVTVIPATTIYYEDSFLEYDASGTTWEDEGTAVSGATQDQDRPGESLISADIDADNIYGYDSAYREMSKFSLGTAKKVHVAGDAYATASFTFWGTGFDVISMTSNTTGVLAVKITDANGNKVKSTVVNTYYGYSHDGNGNWHATPDTANAIYQVPVIQAEGLTYGKYTVTITATYMSAMDLTTADGYDLYIDAIRIYDPANDGANDSDEVIENAYKADGEGWPSYLELRNVLIEANTFGNAETDAKVEGLVFIDGDSSVGDKQISDYQNYGPNNEVYLASGQSVAFMLDTPANFANAHLGMKSADGNAVTYVIKNISETDGSISNEKEALIDTATDMYYDITGLKDGIIVITNTGTGILSLTNIKFTYESNPFAATDASVMTLSLEDDAAEDDSGLAYAYMTPAAATLTLRSINRPVVEETVPETTEPETTEPETTVPEVTEPEVTEPETTEPETTEPETTEPEVTEPEVTEPETTEPETTAPETTVPEETEPEVTFPSTGNKTVDKLISFVSKLLGWLFR